MRYIEIGGEVIPKHCKYGPRPAEGMVLSNREWWSITDHLVKDRRERELGAVLRAKQEAKKEISLEMTRNWSNTLTSVKTQSNQKRLEKLKKEKQNKIDEYNQILKNRAEEKKEVLADVKKILLEDKDAVKTIKSALLSCLVMDERNKQIELEKKLKNEEAKKDEKWILMAKKDAEDYEREQFEEKIKQEANFKIHRKYLEKQVEEMKQRMEADNDPEAQKQDLINMKLEGEKIQHCNMVEKNYRKNFAAQHMKKTENQLEFERIVKLEEEEEDEINKLYIEYNRKFTKERKQREKKAREEDIERREKISQMLAQKLEEIRAREEYRLASSIQSKEDEIAFEEEMKKEKDKKALADLLEGKKQAEERRRREEKEEKDREKWEIFQAQKAFEILKRKEAEQQEKVEFRRQETMKVLAAQIKEKKEREENELKELEEPLESEEAEKEEIQSYCQEVLNFVKERNLPDFFIKKTFGEIEQQYGFKIKNKSEEKIKQDSGKINQRGEKMKDTEAEKIKQQKQLTQQQKNENKQKSRSMGQGCYCLKY